MNVPAYSSPLDKGYMAAIQVLHTRRRKRPTEPANWATYPSENGPGGKLGMTPGLTGVSSLQGMTGWLQQLGHSVADIDKLNIIHVAGTKGKGSTCAWAESFLREHGKRTGFPKRTGLYTSPHLICPEERARIDFEPLSKEDFARYFFEAWDRLTERNNENTSALPRYHQLLFLVALHAFASEGVESVIIETHHGGEYDATNFISRPVATVITSLGMDHIEQLGPTIENIAWHKAGIFKHGAHAFSAPQESAAAAEVLRNRAAEKGVPIQFVSVDESLLPTPTGSPQLKPAVQMLNCLVGLAAARHFLGQRALRQTSEEGGILNEDDIRQAVEGFSWPGRFHLVVDGPHQWYLDSAHNEMSVSKASEWFIGAVSGEAGTSLKERPKRVLIFGQSSDNRDAVAVLASLAVCLEPVHFDKVIFTLRQDRGQLGQLRAQDIATANSELLGNFKKAWQKHYPDSDVVQVKDVEQAMATAGDCSAAADSRTQTLITGSQLLVGEALSVLNGESSPELIFLQGQLARGAGRRIDRIGDPTPVMNR